MERRRKRHKTVFLENRNSSELYKYNNGTTSNELHFVKDPLHNQKPRPISSILIQAPLFIVIIYIVLYMQTISMPHTNTHRHTHSRSLWLSLYLSLCLTLTHTTHTYPLPKHTLARMRTHMRRRYEEDICSQMRRCRWRLRMRYQKNRRQRLEEEVEQVVEQVEEQEVWRGDEECGGEEGEERQEEKKQVDEIGKDEDGEA